MVFSWNKVSIMVFQKKIVIEYFENNAFFQKNDKYFFGRSRLRQTDKITKSQRVSSSITLFFWKKLRYKLDTQIFSLILMGVRVRNTIFSMWHVQSVIGGDSTAFLQLYTKLPWKFFFAKCRNVVTLFLFFFHSKFIWKNKDLMSFFWCKLT